MKTDRIPLVAALYARVSTEKQEKQETIESQIAEVKQKIEADGNVLTQNNVFVDDGWSGMILARPSLDSLRDAIKDRGIQVVYVYDLGRLSRDFTDQMILLREFEMAEIKFISLRDINPTTPAEEMMQKVMGVFHDYDRRNIVEKFRRGKMYKAKQKIIVSGQSLYGYTYIRKTDKKAPRIEINQEEAEIVRKIFRWVGIEGLSIRGVIMRLYRLRIYPKKRKRDVWSKGPIVRMLKCKTYFDGIAYYNKSEAIVAKNPIKHDKYKKVKRTSRRVRPEEDWLPFKIDPIFDDDLLFKRVQKILEDNKKYASKNRKYDYLLTGKTYCEHGFRRVGDGYSKGSNHYYRSAARIYEYPKETKCDCRGVNAVVLDNLFWNRFYEFLTNPILLRKQAEKWFIHRDEYSQLSLENLSEIDKKIEGLREEELRYAKMRGASQIDTGQFEDLMKDVKGRKRQYLDQKEEIKNKANINQNNDINLDELCQEAERVIKLQDATDKKQIVRDLVEKVIIKKGGDEVETWIHIPLNQAHLMGYESNCRNCWSAKCR